MSSSLWDSVVSVFELVTEIQCSSARFESCYMKTHFVQNHEKRAASLTTLICLQNFIVFWRNADIHLNRRKKTQQNIKSHATIKSEGKNNLQISMDRRFFFWQIYGLQKSIFLEGLADLKLLFFSVYTHECHVVVKFFRTFCHIISVFK